MICDNCKYNPKTCDMIEVRNQHGVIMDYTEYVCTLNEQKEIKK